MWRFHYQHGKYLLQCRQCRKRSRACPFRQFEDDAKRGGRQRPISISDSESEESYKETKLAGPSSCPQERAQVRDADGYSRLKDTLLEARKRKVEIETEAEIELARINSIIEEAECNLKKVK